MNYLAFSIVIIGLIIGCIFYDELYNKNVENMSEEVQKGVAYSLFGALIVFIIIIIIKIPALRIN